MLLPLVSMIMWQLPIPIKSDLKERFEVCDECDVSDSAKFTSHWLRILRNSWVSWTFDQHCTQTVLSFERLRIIGDRKPKLLICILVEDRGNEMFPNGEVQGREFMVGDIQDQTRDGKTSQNNPSYLHRVKYPMPFDLTNK